MLTAILKAVKMLLSCYPKNSQDTVVLAALKAVQDAKKNYPHKDEVQRLIPITWSREGSPPDRPEAAADEPLGRGDAPKHVDEHSNDVVDDVRGVDPPGVGDDDATARALVEVDVVDGGGRADDATKGGDSIKERGGQVDGAGAPNDCGVRGFGHGGGKEDQERLARGQDRARGTAGAARH
jgi:hypothetical protein